MWLVPFRGGKKLFWSALSLHWEWISWEFAQRGGNSSNYKVDFISCQINLIPNWLTVLIRLRRNQTVIDNCQFSSFRSKFRKIIPGFLSKWMEYDHDGSFSFDLNEMEFSLVHNRKENCHHNYIPFNLKGNWNIFLWHQVSGFLSR